MPTIKYGNLNSDISHTKNGFIGLLKIWILKALEKNNMIEQYTFFY